MCKYVRETYSYVERTYRSHVLQATDEEECQMWVTSITAGVVAAYSDRSRTLSHGDTSLPNHSRLSHSASHPVMGTHSQQKKTSR